MLFENEPKHIHCSDRYNAIEFLDPKNRIIAALDCILYQHSSVVIFSSIIYFGHQISHQVIFKHDAYSLRWAAACTR